MQSMAYLPTELWTEIPNYDRLVFCPIASQDEGNQPRSKSRGCGERSHDGAQALAERLERFRFDELYGLQEKSFSWPHNAEGEGAKVRPRVTKRDIRACLGKSEDEPQPQRINDEELALFKDSDPLCFNFDIRCPAPSPMTMMNGRAVIGTPENASTPTATLAQPMRETKMEKEDKSQSKHKKKRLDVDVDLVSRRAPPPRPEGVAPLNLEELTRQGNAAESNSISSPRVLSPRVQKPGSAPVSRAGGPDQSKAVPSIQSPRSAFSQKEMPGQK